MSAKIFEAEGPGEEEDIVGGREMEAVCWVSSWTYRKMIFNSVWVTRELNGRVERTYISLLVIMDVQQ